MNKVIPLYETVALVQPGNTLGLGGMTLYRRPVAFVRELLKTDVRDLTLLCFTAAYESDLLVGAGRVGTVRACYFGLEAFGLAPMFTAQAAGGAFRIVEESEGSLAFGLRATLAGVGFMPGPGWLGTDMLTVRPDVKVIDDPYTGKPVVAFPALTCDVAVIHAPIADRAGNARLGGNLAVDRELSMVARHVIVTAEEIVDALDAPVDIGQNFTTAVAHAPRGAWPTSCHLRYPIDGGEILRYIDACASNQFEDYLRTLLGAPAAG